MKTLVIGMDGASLETFKRGWTPYIESIIEKGYSLDLKVDLLSRGWVETFIGKHAIETGAVYDLPLLNGSLDWTTKFGIEKIPGWGTEVKPIWQVLNERGYKVGIMNIPTTFPAPNVDGFFVSGGGGGAKVVQEATEELCYPKDIVNYLQKVGYIVDIRMPDLYEKNLLTVEEVFSQFEFKNQKRTEAFIQLSKEKKVDFGYVVYKTSSVMVEFFTIPELEKELKGEKKIDTNLLQRAKKYYQKFDKQIKTLVESFQEAEIIFVSDHSEVKTNFVVDINYFLQMNGFQAKQPKQIANRVSRYAKDLAKANLPANVMKIIRSLREKYQKNSGVIKQSHGNLFLFDPKKSMAFCVPRGDWVRGIYINDEGRFNGIVPQNDIIDLSHEISNKINNDDIAKEHGITSHVKPRFDTHISKYYPDVVVDIPDGYIVTNGAKGFVNEFEGIKVKNANFDTVEMWSKMRAERKWLPLTVRGYHPIAVSSKQWTKEISPMSMDLTVIYRHLLKQFSI